MPTQKEIWEREHATGETFVRIHSDQPSAPIPVFEEFLRKHGLVPVNTNVLDIGCGNGRNTAHLASLGYKATGFDFSSVALAKAREKQADGLHLIFEEVDLTERWPLRDESVDVIVDCNATLDIAQPGRGVALTESYRVLSKGGFYLFYGVSPREQPFAVPGPEPSSIIFVRSGKFEKQYTKEGLLETYGSVGFKLIDLSALPGRDTIDGVDLEYQMWVGVFTK